MNIQQLKIIRVKLNGLRRHFTGSQWDRYKALRGRTANMNSAKQEELLKLWTELSREDVPYVEDEYCFSWDEANDPRVD